MASGTIDVGIGFLKSYGNLPSGTDLDDVNNIGIYWLLSSGTYSHLPGSGSGMLLMLKSSPTGAAGWQVVLRANTIYFRPNYGTASGWNAWKSVDLS